MLKDGSKLRFLRCKKYREVQHSIGSIESGPKKYVFRCNFDVFVGG